MNKIGKKKKKKMLLNYFTVRAKHLKHNVEVAQYAPS